MGELLSATETAQRLGMVDTRLQRWARQGYIPAQRVGRTWAVDPARVEALLEAGLLPPSPGPIARWRRRLLELATEGGGGLEPRAAEKLARGQEALGEAMASGDRGNVLLELADVVYYATMLDDRASAQAAAARAGLKLDVAEKVALARYEVRTRNAARGTVGTPAGEQAEREAVLAVARGESDT